MNLLAMVRLGRRTVLVAVVAIGALLAAAGIAYATIPDNGGVYTACYLNSNGQVRLIDPSLGSTSPLGHCTPNETQASWNQVGQQGPQGPKGDKGDPGTNGTSPTVAALAAGDAHCPGGGAALTDTNGTTAYVCSAQTSGTFTSPNGQFSISVKDDGVQINGPGSNISMDSVGNITVTAGGSETVTVGHDRTEAVGGNDSITDNGNRSERVGANDSVNISGNQSVQVGGNQQVTVGGRQTTDASGGVALNAGAQCYPVARVGDAVDTSDPAGGDILTGSTAVCAG